MNRYMQADQSRPKKHSMCQVLKSSEKCVNVGGDGNYGVSLDFIYQQQVQLKRLKIQTEVSMRGE